MWHICMHVSAEKMVAMGRGEEIDEQASEQANGQVSEQVSEGLTEEMITGASEEMSKVTGSDIGTSRASSR
jgi:hypothetical protein